MTAGNGGGKRFQREDGGAFTFLGSGELGGKASGLAGVRTALLERFPEGRYRDLQVDIPRMTVLRTGIFEELVSTAGLEELAGSEEPDPSIARRFLRQELPAAVVGDLFSLISASHEPLAIRSSSLFEDALEQPLAGVYLTKMIPNNQPGAEERFRRLLEAVKLVYASTYFRDAREYCRARGLAARRERMAVIIQEIVGSRFAGRFYPTVSGVARSWNYYPTGHARAEDGIASLALGLGKTIVDGGAVWSYSPAYPSAPPPYPSTAALLKSTQTRFWAVNMGAEPAYDPTRETEYLLHEELARAEEDGALAYVTSTYDPGSDRLVMGISRPGPRVLDFAPLLKGGLAPLNELVVELLSDCAAATGGPVELEFALRLDPARGVPPRFGLLQVRPTGVREAEVEVDLEGIGAGRLLLASERVMGNGIVEDLRRIVYVKPDSFRAEETAGMVAELAECNRRCLEEGEPYLLLGFGRWGSSDPWLGVPASWSQLSGARVVVEAAAAGMEPDPSQGSHFFHNILSAGVLYFTVDRAGSRRIDWAWMESQPALQETQHLKMVRCRSPLTVMVDGRRGQGVVLK